MDNLVTIFIIYVIPAVLFVGLLFVTDRLYQTLKLTEEDRVNFCMDTFLILSNIIYAICGILMLCVSFSVTLIIIGPVIICITQLCALGYLLCLFRSFSKYMRWCHLFVRIIVIAMSLVWIIVEYVHPGVISTSVPWFMLFLSISAIFSFFGMYHRLSDENISRNTNCSSRDIYIILLVLALRSAFMGIGIIRNCENFQIFGIMLASYVLMLMCDIFFQTAIKINLDNSEYFEDDEETLPEGEPVNIEVAAA